MMAATGEGATGSSYNVLIYEDPGTGDPSLELFPTRLLCHVLLSQIPSEGLSEALDTLSVIWDNGRASLPAVSSPAPVLRGAKIVSSRRADPIVIVEG
ncbi:MAG TPA: hypothetical protein VLM76_00860 [Patescibacteria group bacterium]|nr:hypothetical protein [Patescibacteria group bacterium]